MNSLEWVNDIMNLYRKEIKRLKESIKSTLPIHEKAIESLTRNCEEIKKELNILQQIKSELEAWYAVKKHLESFSADYFNGITENGILMTSKVNENEYQIIKKALEEEDD